MKNYNISDLYYTQRGEGEPIILLHGWGCENSIFDDLAKNLSKTYKVYSIDFPGFGNSPEPEQIWGTQEYSKLIEEFITKNQIIKPILICHSFGGRVAIDLVSRLNIAKSMVLTGAAGIRHRKSFSVYSKIMLYKFLKNLSKFQFLNEYEKRQIKDIMSNYGSSDYKLASNKMKQILARVVNEDLTENLNRIKIPTLLIWGNQDTATPLKDGKIMDRKIPNSSLKVFQDAGHYAFLDEPNEFYSEIKNFIR